MPSRRTLSRLIAGTAVVAAVGLGAAAVAARTDHAPRYRTAVAGRHQVDQVLDTVGTIEPVTQASVAFPVAGSVQTVKVGVGDTVGVGQQLASLDVGDLTDTLDAKQAALDQAELTLELALAGESVGSVTGGAPSGNGVGRAAAGGSSTALHDAQQAVLDAQKAVDDALAAAQTALDTADQVCAADGGGTTTTTSTTVAADPTDPTACQQALAASLAAQRSVSAAQQDLADAAAALTELIEDLTSKPGGERPTGSTTTTTQPAGPPSGGTTTGGGAPSGSSTRSTASTSPSAEDLIAYQKQVDAAALAVIVADQAVDQATIVSPIAGTVASVGLAVGDDVTAASSTQAIVVVGAGGFEVTTNVSVKDLPDVEVGQSAAVTPDGIRTSVDGEIVRIGVAGEGSGSSTTYPVTVALTGDTSGLRNGATASVVITTAASGAALAVPTSAVTVDGDKATVQRVVDGTAKSMDVELGAVGSAYTEITEGLTAGDVVVLADLDEALPGSATSSSGAGTRTVTGFPGGGVTGGPPSGFPGGGRPGG